MRPLLSHLKFMSTTYTHKLLQHLLDAPDIWDETPMVARSVKGVIASLSEKMHTCMRMP